MTEKERAQLAARRRADKAAATTGQVVGLAGGYIAGRYARNSTIAGFPLPLAAGGLGIFLGMRGRRGRGTRIVKDLMLGMGAYGAGQLGEKHGVEAGNDGNLFSWSKDAGFTTD